MQLTTSRDRKMRPRTYLSKLLFGRPELSRLVTGKIAKGERRPAAFCDQGRDSFQELTPPG